LLIKDQCRTNDGKVNIVYTYQDLWMSSGMYPAKILEGQENFLGEGKKTVVGSCLRSYAYTKRIAAKMVC